MNSSTNLDELVTNPSASDAPLLAEGGIRVDAEQPDDPYAALDDLMLVIEALCPVWPSRPLFSRMDNLRL